MSTVPTAVARQTRPSNPTPQPQEAEKDAPLREDIRLLGRILGDTVREQEGAGVFETVERIRQASIRFHRDNEVGARRELEAILDSLTADHTLMIVRAFSYFSHLSNIAEDQHHIRRNRAHILEGSAPREGAMDHALKRAREAGIDARALRAFFDGALVSPVLTAHPTEVRRKSTLTRELEIAEIIAERDRMAGAARELEQSEERLRRAILTLWRTNMLRQTRLKVLDEVANGLSYYDYTFFRELPRIYAALEDELARQTPQASDKGLASFLKVGSWIGGDRDGNPFVTADVLRETMRLQSALALGHYLDELHLLGGELSVSGTLMRVSPALVELAERSTDRSTHRHDEPYRRAIGGIYSRLAATARELDHVVVARHPLTEAPPYRAAAELVADLDVIVASLEANGGAAPSIASASIWPRSTCARTPTSTSARSPNCWRRRRPASPISSSTRTRGSRCCCANCARRAHWSRRSSPIARRRRANSRCSAPPPGSMRPTARPRSAPASSRRRRACPTCWSSRCC
jgi:phosphoenolpyruvate carboxylase